MKSLLVSFVSVNKWPFSRISKYEKLLRIVECNYVHRRVDTDLWLDILQRSVLVISTKPDEEVGVAYDRQLREANITFLIKESFPVRGVVHDDVITYNKTMNERNGSIGFSMTLCLDSLTFSRRVLSHVGTAQSCSHIPILRPLKPLGLS